MLKRELEAMWASDPQTVFRYKQSHCYRGDEAYCRIVEKKGAYYLAEVLRLTQRGLHKGQWVTEDKKPEWTIRRSTYPYSCKDLERVLYPRFEGKTLEGIADALNREYLAEWEAEHEKLQVKPRAIADLLTLTDLRERDLQATPERVLVALRDALTVKVGA